MISNRTLRSVDILSTAQADVPSVSEYGDRMPPSLSRQDADAPLDYMVRLRKYFPNGSVAL